MHYCYYDIYQFKNTVFVHGLTGNQFLIQTAPGATTLWLNLLLPVDILDVQMFFWV